MSHPNNELRQDITGLRAVAVIAVTLFHITHVLVPDSALFQGGFLGVDIFFVISGFLMTKIIMTGLDRGNFSLYIFYKRRAKRICPALFVTILVFVAISTLLIESRLFIDTCRDGLRALGFISNFWFSRQAGYFDGDASERLFLHTWSLSVEWQFYLIYPLVLMIANKIISRRLVGLLILLLTIASLVFGCIYTVYSPVKSYYLLPSRAYELLVGSLAYFYPVSYFIKLLKKNDSEESLVIINDKLSRILEVIGLICILVSLLVVDSSAGWPNFWSVLPLIGTYLCIAADNKYTVLSNVVFQKLGLWSYAIYLVHWPVIVLFEYFAEQSVAWELLPLIFVLGVLLHYGVERRRNFAWGFLVLYFVFAGGIEWIVKTEGSVLRNGMTIVGFPGKDLCKSGAPCAIGNLSRPVDLILTGDSYARQYVATLNEYDLHVVAHSLDGCFTSKNFYVDTFSDDPSYDKQCRDKYAELMKLIKLYPDVPVLWAQNWPEYAKKSILNRKDQAVQIDFDDLLKHEIPEVATDVLTYANRLYIIGKPRSGDANNKADLGKICAPLYRMDNVISSFVARLEKCQEVVPLLSEPKTNIELKSIISNLPQNQGKGRQDMDVAFIDPAEAYCNEQNCRIMQANTYEPFFFDGGNGDHFSKFGSDLVVKHIVNKLQQDRVILQ